MRKLTLLCLLLTCLITGCVPDANRVYTVCKTDGDLTYLYSDTGFFTVSNNTIVECPVPNLERKPALKLFGTNTSFTFDYRLPGLYEGTLEDVSSYVNYLVEKDNVSYHVTYSDSENIELFLTCSDYSGRIIYNIHGEVRMYFRNNFDLSISPIYLLEGD